MVAFLAALIGMQVSRPRVTQIPPVKPVLKFIDADFSVRPRSRSASYILQSNPTGVAELLAANGRISSFSYIVPNVRSARITPSFRPNTSVKTHRRAGNPGAFRANFSVTQILTGSGIDITAAAPLSTIDFGAVMSNDPAPTRTVAFTKVSPGKISYSLSGSPAFTVSVAKAVEYVAGSDFESGYEKTVEWNSSPFPASSGSQVTFYLEYNNSKFQTPQSGVLTIKDGDKSMSYSLKGEVVQKQLSLKVNSVSLSSSAIAPQEAIDVTVNMNVTQNSGSQLGFKLIEPPQGVTLYGSDQWVGNAGATSHHLKIQTDGTVQDNPALTLTAAIYRGDTQETLATFPITYSVTRQWLEWSYKRSAGKQDIWGVLQVANTGEFIWNVHAYNSSSIFPDQFFTAICFAGVSVGGQSPAVFTVGSLPMGGHDTGYYQITGKMPISDFSKLKTELLHSYLGIHEGGPLAALGEAGSGFVDLMKSGFGASDYNNIPNNFGGKAVKWLQSKHAKAVPLTSAKFWF